MTAVQGWERAIYTLSVRRSQPHNTKLTYRKKDEKGKTVEDKKGPSSLGQ